MLSPYYDLVCMQTVAYWTSKHASDQTQFRHIQQIAHRSKVIEVVNTSVFETWVNQRFFRHGQKVSSNNGEFIVLVMTGNSTSNQAITSGVNVKSNPHVFFNDFWTDIFFWKRFKHRKYLRFISAWIVWNCILSTNEIRIYVNQF